MLRTETPVHVTKRVSLSKAVVNSVDKAGAH